MAKLTTQQSQDLYGTAAYTAWEEEEARQDAAAKGLTGGGGESNSILQTAINSILQLIPGDLKDYEKENPFFFDEALAKEAATAQYSPYYAELLSDYVADVEKTKSRSAEDLKITLEQLSGGREYYLGKERRLLDRALESTDKGYAGRGLFFSGAREKDRREYTEEYEEGIGEYERRYEAGVSGAKLGKARTLEDVIGLQKRYTRDVGREEETAIAGGVLQRKREVREEYEVSRGKYYEGALYPSII